VEEEETLVETDEPAQPAYRRSPSLKSQLVAETRTAVEAEINARLREIIAGSTETITEELLKHLEVSLKSQS
jgi:hypothetical protein